MELSSDLFSNWDVLDRNGVGSEDMSKLAIVIRHLAFEDLGAFQPELEAAGFVIHYVDIGLNSLQDVEERNPDLLVVLGGPIGGVRRRSVPILAR